jgi:hypothetical protein
MKKMINILPYFRARVVKFVFGVRNSGQKETKIGAPSVAALGIMGR